MSTITETEWRDCYYLYRVMHDGICPQCGYVSDKEDMEDYVGNIICQNSQCEFTMSAQEIEAILSRSSSILKRRLDSFSAVRSKLVTTIGSK